MSPTPRKRRAAGRRGLIASLVVVGLLVVASLYGLVTGVTPLLGLDLQGGVRVVLQAPANTSKDVMNQALESIRRRVDALGVAEPDINLSGTNIEVQIPGLAKGTIEQHPKTQYCLTGKDGQTYKCLATQSAADTELQGIKVTQQLQQVCLTAPDGTSYGCFGTKSEANTALKAIAVVGQGKQQCLSGTTATPQPCFKTKQAATAAKDGTKEVTTSQWVLLDSAGKVIGTPYATQAAAEAALNGISVEKKTTEYCVFTSDGKNIGCYVNNADAENRLQSTSQQHLLEIIGQTARLEQREVLQTIPPSDPAYASSPVTCPVAEQLQPNCTFQALRNQPVTFLGSKGVKYNLGPVQITGDAISKATAVFATAGQTNSGGIGWQVDFNLTPDGSKTFATVTQNLLNKQLAIVLDQKVISAPTVQGAITGGSGVLTGGSGGFSETQAKDLATQLNAGALPTALKQQAVQTVSATLGKESLSQGLLAGIIGLIALMLYLLFYYRLLGIVTWFGMAIWAILALGFISLLGHTVGYSLTLAGVAGLIVSLGITADSYIVFYERIKDEVRRGKTPRSAIQPAFGHAWHTIVAADTVTILAAAVLYLVAISSVRGFALTLGISTALDMFVVYFFKRPTVFLLSRNEKLMNLPGFGLTTGVAADVEPDAVPAIAGASE